MTAGLDAARGDAGGCIISMPILQDPPEAIPHSSPAGGKGSDVEPPRRVQPGWLKPVAEKATAGLSTALLSNASARSAFPRYVAISDCSAAETVDALEADSRANASVHERTIRARCWSVPRKAV